MTVLSTAELWHKISIFHSSGESLSTCFSNVVMSGCLRIMVSKSTRYAKVSLNTMSLIYF